MAGTNTKQFEKNKLQLTQKFGACDGEKNKKWAEYLICKVPRRIRTIKELKNVTVEMAE